MLLDIFIEVIADLFNLDPRMACLQLFKKTRMQFTQWGSHIN